MDLFSHRDGRLHCESIALGDLAAAVGTPAYVYSAGTVDLHVDRLRAAFGDLDPLMCFSVKANGNLALLERLRRRGLGFDIVSEGELARVRAVGADPQKVVFSGVGKQTRELEAAIEFGILQVNAESEGEVEHLAWLAARMHRRVDVAVRVNPDIEIETHDYVATGRREAKFGVDRDRVEGVAARILELPSLRLTGLQCHIGSQITAAEPYARALERLVELAKTLQPRALDLHRIDLGGGFGIYYQDAKAPALSEYARVIRPLLSGLPFSLLLEPGRVIVGNAGVLLTRVLYRKRSGRREFVVVDAGMNDLLRPSLYGGYHRIWPVEGPPLPPWGVEIDAPKVDVVGPVCESGDFLARDRPLPPVRIGEVLAVMSVGAYGFAMSSNYNSRPRPCEVLVDGSRYGVVRARESIEDLLRLEDPDPVWRVAEPMAEPIR